MTGLRLTAAEPVTIGDYAADALDADLDPKHRRWCRIRVAAAINARTEVKP